MKTLFTSCIVLASLALQIYGQGSAFTYQGRVSDNNGPLNGTVALTFKIYMAEIAVVPIWQETHASVPVSNGLFVVTLGRLQPAGETIFTGDPRFMGISVNGGAELTPRREITAAPYAVAARRLTGVVGSTSLAGVYTSVVHFNNMANRFSGDGGGLTNLNAATIGGQSASDFWQTSGNVSGGPDPHFIGTLNDAHLEFKVNGVTALRLQPSGSSTPNVIGGSFLNSVDDRAEGATIAGGGGDIGPSDANRVRSHLGTIGGGSGNVIDGDLGDKGSFMSGATIAGGQYNSVRSLSSWATIGGGSGNEVRDFFSTISGGSGNQAFGGSSIGGGYRNTATVGGAIGGGAENLIAALGGTIGGGQSNYIALNATYSNIGGGQTNTIAQKSTNSTIAGGFSNDIGTNSSHSAIGGGNDNNVAAHSSAIAGGRSNDIGTNSPYATIAGGQNNSIRANSHGSAIGGGATNNILANSPYSTIAGGWENDIGTNSTASAIGGGEENNVGPASVWGAIAGGYGNTIGSNSTGGTISGGFANTIANNSVYATIAGGEVNYATNRAFAAGRRAKARHSGAFVWGDSNNADVTSTNVNSVTMRASGGYRLFANGVGTIGVYLAPNSGGWIAMSDRNTKENFEPVDARAVLEKVAALPMSTWNYKSQTNGIRHIGAMAQDFKTAFGLGETDTGINTVDADGVALAAVQGLNQKVDEELRRRDAENAELKRTVNELKELIEKLNRGAR